MSVPKKRKSSSRTKRGTSHASLKKVTLSTCTNCKKSIKPHHACTNCGTYNKVERVKIRPSKEERTLAKKAKAKKTKTKDKK